ncbi:MAG: sigma-70 family RNA polymerase sigma factor [Sphingomonas sp.]
MTNAGSRTRASEEQLRLWMCLGLDGDAKAHQALLRALAPMMRSFFGRRMRGAGDDIEDLVQETLIAIHTRRSTYDRERPFAAWAYAVARYKMIDHFRRNRNHVSFEDLEEILVAEGYQEAASAQMDVNKLLDGISAKQAMAIRDTKIEGLSIAEAADKAGISESDVKVSVHRGLKALADRMKGK